MLPPLHSSRSIVRIRTWAALLLGAARASLWPPPSLCRLGSPRTGTRLNQTAPCIGQAPAPFLTVNARKSDPRVSDTWWALWKPTRPRAFSVRAGGAVGLGSGQPWAPAGRPPAGMSRCAPSSVHIYRTTRCGDRFGSSAQAKLGQTRNARMGNRTARAVLVMELSRPFGSVVAAWVEGLMVLAFLGSHGEDCRECGSSLGPAPASRSAEPAFSRGGPVHRSGNVRTSAVACTPETDGPWLWEHPGGAQLSHPCAIVPAFGEGFCGPLGGGWGPSALTVLLEGRGAPSTPLSKTAPTFLL